MNQPGVERRVQQLEARVRVLVGLNLLAFALVGTTILTAFKTR